MAQFRAVVVDKNEAGQTVALRQLDEADLMPGDVRVQVTHSSLNYKDGLAITGKAPVVRRFPMVPGIDFAGTVQSATTDAFKPGDRVVLTGWGVGETHLGGYAELAQVKSDWLVKLPDGMAPEDAMAIGTAGLTAMLSVMALDAHGLKPEHGPAIVTGASGGVGSVAVALLAARGWHVIASTGRAQESDYLKSLGAAEILDRAELTAPGKPLGKERWAAGVDCVGSVTLANLLAQTGYHGAIAACGLAQGMDLPASVAPFILRGVSLLGIDSVMAPPARRAEAWARLSQDLKPDVYRAITRTIGLEDVIEAGKAILAGSVRGRTVVRVQD